MSEIDIKATPADFIVGDFSDPQLPRGPWCGWHGYYGDCPECAGRTERWTFRIVSADSTSMVIDEAWTDTGTAWGQRRVGVEGQLAEEAWSGSGPAQTGEQLRRRTEANRQGGDSDDVPRSPDHVPLRASPGLLA